MNAVARTRRTAPKMVEGEYTFTVDNFRCIARLLNEESGIHLPEGKATLVYSRLAKRVRALKLGDFDEYCALIASNEGEAERKHMFSALTTNVTRFYREPHHFEHLRDLLAPIAPAVRRGQRLRLWSSACSTGQEPYSMALTLLQAIPEAPSLDVRILATDIDPVVVETARTGIYSAEAVDEIPNDLRERWMQKQRGDGATRWSAGPEMRSLITFKQLNLIGDWPMRGKFDAIFCRNVVIYFEEATQNRIWTRFRSLLNPEGRLYIGHSERIDVQGYESDGLTIYRLGKRKAP